ncbi:MAG: CRISPR-associated endoribonuclease Cas6 [Egibacteraceae bacterium]
MRLVASVSTTDEAIRWEDLHGPGRGVVYAALSEYAPALGTQIHGRGWGRWGLVPFAVSPPEFPGAPRRKGVYAVAGTGTVEFASPLPEVLEAVARYLQRRGALTWARTSFTIQALDAVAPPAFADGVARFTTATAVLVKGVDDYLLPTADGYEFLLGKNLEKKADTLGLPTDVSCEVTWAGTRRLLRVGGAPKVGAVLDLRVTAAPEVLSSLWSWGVGQLNSAGFGLVRA